LFFFIIAKTFPKWFPCLFYVKTQIPTSIEIVMNLNAFVLWMQVVWLCADGET